MRRDLALVDAIVEGTCRVMREAPERMGELVLSHAASIVGGDSLRVL